MRTQILSELSQRVGETQHVLSTLLAGGKYDPAQHPLLKKQLGFMHDDGYVLAEPSAYEQKNNGKDIVTRQNPMRHTQRNNRNRLLAKLDDKDIQFVHILGSQVRQRTISGESIPEYAKVYICPKADMYAMREMTSIIKAKLDALQSGDTENPIIKKPLIIVNQDVNDPKETAKYYDALLGNLNIKGDIRDELNIVTVDTVNAAVSHAEHALYVLRDLDTPPRPKLDPALKPGDTIFIHTTTVEKLRDYQEIFRERGITVRMLSALERIAESPAEHSHSFEGNAEEKLRAAQKMIAEIPDEVFTTKFGLKRSQVHVMVDDSGFYMNEPRLLDHMNLEDMGGIINKDEWKRDKIPFPGVELGPLMNASNGLKNFMDRIIQALDDIDAQYNVPADRSMTDVSCLAISAAPDYDPSVKDIPLAEYRPKVMDFMMYANKDLNFKARTEKNLRSSGIDPRLVESKDYQMPAYDNPKNKTMGEFEAEDPSWRVRNHVRALASRALMSELGLPERSKHPELYKDFDNQRRQTDTRTFTISLQGAKHDKLAHALIQQGVASPQRDEAHPLQTLSEMEDVIKTADGFVLLPHNDNNDLAEKCEKAFRFWSLLVARQTDPRDNDKPIVIYNPHHEWDKHLEEYKELHALGAVKEKPELMFKVINGKGEHGIKEITTYLKQQREQRDPPINYANHGEDNITPKNDVNRFNVAIFCSANSEKESYQADVYNLSYNLCKDGFGVVYGGGSRYMIGKIADGAQAAQNDGFDASITGSSMDHLVIREGVRPNILKEQDSYHSAKHIYQRMEYMIASSDAFVIAPGGIGTLQELYALMLLQAQHAKNMTGKEIVIVNKQDEHGHGFYDPILANISLEERKQLGITVVSTVEEAKNKVDEFRIRSDKNKSIEHATSLPPENSNFVDRFTQEKLEKAQKTATRGT